MNCVEFRQILGAAPGDLGVEAKHHAESCPGCQALLQESHSFEATLRAAFGDGVQVDIAVPPARPVFPRPGRRSFVLGGAAAVAAATTAVIFRSWPPGSLAEELVSHVTTASLAKETPLQPQAIRDALSVAGIALLNPHLNVSFASNCQIRSRTSAHLVLPSRSGPVSAFLMPAVAVEALDFFEETPWVGRLSPFETGSIAVIGLNHGACKTVERQLKLAVAFT